MKKNTGNNGIDQTLKSCKVTTAQEALKGKFAQSLFERLSETTKYEKRYLESLLEHILDESCELSQKEANDFLDFLDMKNQYFDELIQRYIGRFPAWVQKRISKFSNDMHREDHVLYSDGKYVSLEKIKEYVKSRVKPLEASENTQSKQEAVLWQKIQDFANTNSNALQGKDLLQLKKIAYKEYIDQSGNTVSELEGIRFISMDTADTPFETFSINDFTALDNNEKTKRIACEIPVDLYPKQITKRKWENVLNNPAMVKFEQEC